MFKKVGIILIILILLLLAGCSSNNTSNTMGIEINTITSSIGAVGENINDFDTQRFRYTITLTNNDVSDIKIVSIEPVLSEEFIERALDEDRIVHVNEQISHGNSIDVSGEIIFDAKGLAKEQIVSMKPFVKKVRIIEERIINKSF